jgi:DNA-binding MarR family transcriptional regulator
LLISAACYHPLPISTSVVELRPLALIKIDISKKIAIEMKTWISLRAVLESLHSETDYGQLDVISQRLLEWISVRNRKADPLHVQEIVLKSEIASPATIHKSIALLEERGLITVNIDPHDSRRRIVLITAHAEKLLIKLSKGVESWAKSVVQGLEGRNGSSGK